MDREGVKREENWLGNVEKKDWQGTRLKLREGLHRGMERIKGGK